MRLKKLSFSVKLARSKRNLAVEANYKKRRWIPQFANGYHSFILFYDLLPTGFPSLPVNSAVCHLIQQDCSYQGKALNVPTAH